MLKNPIFSVGPIVNRYTPKRVTRLESTFSELVTSSSIAHYSHQTRLYHLVPLSLETVDRAIINGVIATMPLLPKIKPAFYGLEGLLFDWLGVRTEGLIESESKAYISDIDSLVGLMVSSNYSLLITDYALILSQSATLEPHIDVKGTDLEILPGDYQITANSSKNVAHSLSYSTTSCKVARWLLAPS